MDVFGTFEAAVGVIHGYNYCINTSKNLIYGAAITMVLYHSTSTYNWNCTPKMEKCHSTKGQAPGAALELGINTSHKWRKTSGWNCTNLIMTSWIVMVVMLHLETGSQWPTMAGCQNLENQLGYHQNTDGSYRKTSKKLICCMTSRPEHTRTNWRPWLWNLSLR